MTREIEQRSQLLDTLNRMSAIMFQPETDSFEHVLHRCMGTMAGAIDVDRVYIWKNHEVSGELYCTQLFEWPESAEPRQNGEYTADIPYSGKLPGWREKLSQGHCINSLVRDMSTTEQAQLFPQGSVSVLVVPVFFQSKFWGFVGFDDCHKERVFSEDEEIILHSASQLVAYALLRNEMEREVADQNELNRVMFDAAPIGLTIYDDSLGMIDCNEAVLSIYGVTREYYTGHFFDLSPEYQPDGSKSYESAIEILKRALNGEKLTFEWMHCSLSGEPIPCEVTLTRVDYKGRYIVLGYVYDLSGIKSLEKDVERLETEAGKIFYDPLTGIYNRRYFEENAKHIIRSLSRSGGTLCLMMVDIDYFKKYNDAYGHVAGDNCLKAIAEVLTNELSRTDDFAARYGGEEFVVVLPNTDESGARKVACRLLESVQKRNIPHETSEVANCVTVSIGAASGKAAHTHVAADYVRRADEMLYKSKNEGRNRYNFTCL